MPQRDQRRIMTICLALVQLLMAAWAVNLIAQLTQVMTPCQLKGLNESVRPLQAMMIQSQMALKAVQRANHHHHYPVHLVLRQLALPRAHHQSQVSQTWWATPWQQNTITDSSFAIHWHCQSLKECKAISMGKATILKLMATFPINTAPEELQEPHPRSSGGRRMESVSV